MPLNSLKSAWDHYKLLHSLHPYEDDEILSIIASPERMNKSRLQRILVNLIVFVVITLCCHSG